MALSRVFGQTAGQEAIYSYHPKTARVGLASLPGWFDSPSERWWIVPATGPDTSQLFLTLALLCTVVQEKIGNYAHL